MRNVLTSCYDSVKAHTSGSLLRKALPSFSFLEEGDFNAEQWGCKATRLSPPECAHLHTHNPPFKRMDWASLVVQPPELHVRCKCHQINSLNMRLFSPPGSHFLLGYAPTGSLNPPWACFPKRYQRGKEARSVILCKCTVPQPENNWRVQERTRNEEPETFSYRVNILVKIILLCKMWQIQLPRRWFWDVK